MICAMMKYIVTFGVNIDPSPGLGGVFTREWLYSFAFNLYISVYSSYIHSIHAVVKLHNKERSGVRITNSI